MTPSWFSDERLDAVDAEQRFLRFVAEGPSNRELLHTAMREASIDHGDLAAIVEFVASQRGAEGEALVPAWYGTRDEEAGISPIGAVLHDGLIHDIASRITATTGATWELFVARDALDSRHLQPVLTGVPNRPQEIARACVVGVLHDIRPADAVLGMVERAIAGSEVVESDPTWKVWVEPAPDGRSTIGLPEEAEELLGGAAALLQLWAAFEAEPWLDDMQPHDPGEATAMIAIPHESASAVLTALFRFSIIRP